MNTKMLTVDDKLEFEGVLKCSDVVDGNHCSYTKECLEAAFREYRDSGKQLYGAVFSPGLPLPLPLDEVAFEVKELNFNYSLDDEPGQLKARCAPLGTPKGRDLKRMLEYECDHPGTFSIGMCVMADETEEKDGVTVVKKCSIERVSFIKSEDKV